MERWRKRLMILSAGGVALGISQIMPYVNFNAIWFESLLRILSTLVALLLGGGSADINTGSDGVTI